MATGTKPRSGKRRTQAKKKKADPIKLDIACGRSKQENFVGLDISAESHADIIHDLTVYPWPIEDDSVEEAWCSHYIEHVPMQLADGRDGLFAFMDELYRVMRHDAQVRFVHPHARTDRAFQDPTHRRFIPETTWAYFARDWRELNNLLHYPLACDFGTDAMFFAGWQGDWATRSEEARQYALRHYWNVVSDLVVDLRCRK